MTLILGAKGQVGQCLMSLWPGQEVFFCSRSDLDITDTEKVAKFIRENKVETIINCAAYTKVDLAEEQKEMCDLVNHKSVASLGEICCELNVHLIHVSTDYVFSGKQFHPIQESEPTSPLNFYGHSKRLGEIALEKTKATIVRTSWLYSEFGSNFVKTMIKKLKSQPEVSIVNDQTGSPTYAIDLAQILIKMSKRKDLNGIFHYANKGEVTWFEFGKKINQILGTQCRVLPVSSQEFPVVAQRPTYTVLDSTKIADELNINIPNWEESLKKCLEKIS